MRSATMLDHPRGLTDLPRRFVRRAGAVFCFQCASVASRAENIDKSPPRTENPMEQSTGPGFGSPSLPLAASMRIEDDSDEDEVCIAPKHMVLHDCEE